MKSEKFVIKTNTQTGAAVSGKGNQGESIMLKTETGQVIWLNAALLNQAKAHEVINYTVHPVGSVFVATKDSSRTKGKVLLDKCPRGQEDEPLYSKGDKVTRLVENIEFDGFTEPKATEVSFEDKMAIAAKYGVKITM